MTNLKQVKAALAQNGVTLLKRGHSLILTTRAGTRHQTSDLDLDWALNMGLELVRNEIREKLQAASTQADRLFDRNITEPFHAIASAFDNAGDTAREQGFGCESLAYYQCAIGSLESLLADHKSSWVRRWFKAHNIAG